MKKEKLLFYTLLILFIGLLFASPVGAKMIKEVAIGVGTEAPSEEMNDWFYMRYHGPDIKRNTGPWMTRYWVWIPYDPPEEAVELFGAVKGRSAELWYREEDYIERPDLKGATGPPWWKEGQHNEGQKTVVMVPANPTEEFYDSDPHPEKTTILRWVTIIAYPKGVSAEEGEKWFLETHAKEAVKQPGLLKFVSHRVWENPEESGGNMPTGERGMPPGGMEMAQMPETPSWIRVCEYWYKDFDAWRKAVLESPPKYTVPPWGGEYPFVDIASTFLPYYHEIDLLNNTYTPSINPSMNSNGTSP